MNETMTSREKARRDGMRRALSTFRVKYDMHRPFYEIGSVVMECVNHVTGEIKTYKCDDERTARFIGNTWWILENKEEGHIRVIGYFAGGQPGGVEICTKHVKQGVKSDKSIGNPNDWILLMKARNDFNEYVLQSIFNGDTDDLH